MRMWYNLLVVAAAAVAGGAGEKLGNIEVITRHELGSRGLVPPNKDVSFQADTLTQTKAAFENSADEKPEARFIPLPALSYLPPVKTPLPIEPTAAPQITPGIIILQDDYLPPRGVADEIRPVVETPNTLYIAPGQEPVFDVIQPEIEPSYNTQAHNDGPADPIGAYNPPPTGSVIGVQDDGHFLEGEVGKPNFFSGIQSSKLSLLGGIVGAKSAVFDGLRNAKESFYSGVTGALAAKAAAFTSLKGNGGSYGNYGNYDGDEGYGSIPRPGVAGANLSPNYPPALPNPVTPFPVYAPVPVQAYPAYPPYNPQPIPVYAPPGPIYRPMPNPLASIKAKFEGIVQAKKDAVAGAFAKVAAVKEGIKQKVGVFFNKGGAPYYAPMYHHEPTYGYTAALNANPTITDTYHRQPPPTMTYPVYQTRPYYVSDPTYYYNPPTGWTEGIKEKIASKKASISEAFARAFAKLKAPFQPRFRYGYREW